MIDLVDPRIRVGLVQVRVAGLTRGADCALGMIHSLRARERPNEFDSIAIGLLESEIKYLDGRAGEALESFALHVDPMLSEIDPRVASIVGDNRFLILCEVPNASPGDLYYHLVDQRRILGVELRDYAAALEASMDAARGRHFEALPAFWQQLRTAYGLQNWRAMALAKKDFAYECVRLNLLNDAAYHAVLSMDSEVVKVAAEALLALRSGNQVRATLEKLLRSSFLKKHAIQAALLFECISDAVPDDILPTLVQWLQQWAPFVPSGFHDAPLLEHVWGTIASLSARLGDEATASFAGFAVTHPLMGGGGSRRHLIRALNALCAKLKMDELRSVGDVALVLVGDKKSDIDYVDSVNLLCQVTQFGDDDLKAMIRAKLFPPGRQITDAILLQAAQHLGEMPKSPKEFSESARKLATAILKQVQRLAPGEEPAKLGGYGTMNYTTPNGHVVVHMGGALHWIGALIPYRQQIDETALRELILAILSMIADNDNIIANRADLASQLSNFMDCIPEGLDRRIVSVLEPLADGKIVESPIGQSHAEASNPLNPFKLGTGDPVSLQCAALHSLSNLQRNKPDAVPRFHRGLLISAIISENPEVRKHGLVAAAEDGNLTRVEQTAVALAGLDPDPKVAGLALIALRATIEEFQFKSTTWQIVLRSIEAAVQSSDSGYRRVAAELLKVVSGKKIPRELRSRIASVTGVLQDDICYSVRAALQQKSHKASE